MGLTGFRDMRSIVAGVGRFPQIPAVVQFADCTVARISPEQNLTGHTDAQMKSKLIQCRIDAGGEAARRGGGLPMAATYEIITVCPVFPAANRKGF